VPEHLCQISERTGLGENVYGAQLACSVDRLSFGVGREDDHGQVRKTASDAGENREAVESGHDQIKENTIDSRRLDYIQGFDSVESHENIMTLHAQYLRKHLGHRRVVLDYQYSHVPVRMGSIRAEGFARQGLTFGAARDDR
jgi:hypothetical protein